MIKNDRLLIFLLTLLAFLARVYGYDSEGYWHDELITLWRSSQSVGNIIFNQLDQGNLPLYFLLIKCWKVIASENRFLLLLPGLLCGAAAVPATWLVLSKLPGTGRFALIAAGLLTALSPLQHQLSQELRGYSLLYLLGILLLNSYIEALKARTLKAAVHFAFLALSFGMLHFVAWIFIAALFLHFLISGRKQTGDTRYLATAFGCIASILTGLLIFVLYRSKLTEYYPLMELKAPLTPIHFYFAFGPGNYYAPPRIDRLSVVAGLLTIFLFLVGLKPAYGKKRNFELILAALFLLDLTMVIFIPVLTQPKYYLATVFLFIAFSMRGLQRIYDKHRYPAILLLILLCVFSVANIFLRERRSFMIQNREAAEFIKKSTGPNDGVYIQKIGPEYGFDFYYREPDLYIENIQLQYFDIMSNDQLEQKALNQARDVAEWLSCVWYVTPQDEQLTVTNVANENKADQTAGNYNKTLLYNVKVVEYLSRLYSSRTDYDNFYGLTVIHFCHNLEHTKRINTASTSVKADKLASLSTARNGVSGAISYIPAGCFRMGSEKGDIDEKPEHEVCLSPFFINVFEVTVSQYQDCVDAGLCERPKTGFGCNWPADIKSNHPINCVNWEQAKAYCTWAGMRLPTEAEWELAARGRQARTYPWGETRPDCHLAVMNVGGPGCGNNGTWAVGSKPEGAGPFGNEDMAGNVYEWVEDWYQADFYNDSPEKNPSGPDRPTGRRILRGGSWSGSIEDLKTTVREPTAPSSKNPNIGFRCAASIRNAIREYYESREKQTNAKP